MIWHCISIFRGDSLSSSHIFTHSVTQVGFIKLDAKFNPFNGILSLLLHTTINHSIPSHIIQPHTTPYHPIPTHTTPYHPLPSHATPYHTISPLCITFIHQLYYNIPYWFIPSNVTIYHYHNIPYKCHNIPLSLHPIQSLARIPYISN